MEAFRYLLSVPRKEFALLGDPDQQALLLDGYLRQLPHDQTVIEFTGNTAADLSIATIAGFTGWFIAPSSPARIRRNFRSAPQFPQGSLLGAEMMDDGRGKAACAEMLKAKQEPPLFLYLIWADYTRLAKGIVAARAAH